MASPSLTSWLPSHVSRRSWSYQSVASCGVAAERTRVEDGPRHVVAALEAAGADALQLDRRGHDQVLVVGAARVVARVAVGAPG